jgi:uncharacterized protein (UPF0548 family)
VPDRTDAPFSYPEVGATRSGTVPPGYRRLHRGIVLGRGGARFEEAAGALLGWRMHLAAGLTVRADRATAEPGTAVLLGVGVGRLRITAPCRVVYVVDEPRRRGFAYGTLGGHPERGEELFLVDLLPDDTVRLTVTAFSRPATWWARAAPLPARLAQHVIVGRYLRSLRRVSGR